MTGKRPVRAVIATVTALLTVLMLASPALAASIVKTQGALNVGGVPTPAVQWNAWNDAGNVSGAGHLTLDALGGAQFSGRVDNGYVAGRHIRYRCTLTYGPAAEQITWSTPRYWIAGGTGKSWNWGRITTDKRIALRWSEIWAASSAGCSLIVG